jgi:hypothetical protein
MKHIKRFDEVIKVDIKVGDTVLGGRFKNKKTLVKKIGKNKKGDITINDKPLLKYRIIKEDVDIKDVVTYYLSHLIDDGFVAYDGDEFIRIFKPKYGDVYTYTNLIEFNFAEIAGDIIRFVNSVDDIKNISYMTIAEKPKEYKMQGGGVLFDNLERNVIDINNLEQVNMDMYSLTILF